MKVNDIYTLESNSINNYAKGVSKIDSLLVFTDNFYPGEIGKIKLTTLKKNYAFGEVVELIKKAPYRIPSVCDHSSDSGTCPLNDIEYQMELNIKKNLVLNNLNHNAKLGLSNIDIYSSEYKSGYRNKVTVFFNKEYEAGVFKEGTNDFRVIKSCVQIDDEILNIINKLLSYLKEYKIDICDLKRKTGNVKGVSIRKSTYNNDISVMIMSRFKDDTLYEISNKLKDDFKTIKGISASIRKEFDTFIYSDKEIIYYGVPYIYEKILNVIYKVNNMSFLQVNTPGASILYDHSIHMFPLDKSYKVLDLYSGCGGISLNIAPYINEVIGIEEVKSAVELANFNAKNNKIYNAKFYNDDSINYSKYVNPRDIDLLFLDPPRSGLGVNMCNKINESEFKRIVYVSCDSYTMSKDLLILKEKYNILKVEAHNLFFRTRSVETILSLTLKEE